VLAEPPNEDAPGSGWLLSVDCGTGDKSTLGGGGTSADGVFAEPPNDDAPGASWGVPVEGDTGVAGAGGGGTIAVPGGGNCAADEPTDAEPGVARRTLAAPSWITQ
jgi:hypothetical protein